MHQSAIDQVQKLATVLSPPAPGAPTPGPPGLPPSGPPGPGFHAPAPPTPASATAAPDPTTLPAVAGGSGLVTPNVSAPIPRTLSFSGSSSQGESNGEKEAIEEELDAEPEVLEDAAKEQELYEKLDQMTHEAFNPDLEDEDRQELKTKIVEVTQKIQTNDKQKSFMLAQLRKDATKLKKNLEKQRMLEMENITLKHEHKLEGEVAAHLKIVVSEKETEVSEVNKRLMKLQKEHQKSKDQQKVEIDTLNEIVGNVTKRNNELKIEAAKQKAHIESLEEAIAPEEETEHVEVDVHIQEVAPGVAMDKGSNEHRCHACDKLFNAAKNLENHMKDKHTEYMCNMCEEKFTTRKQSEEHICMEGDISPQVCEKSYCKKEFVSSATLKEHMKSNHFGKQRSVCPKCGEIGDNKWNIKKHMETCSKRSSKDNQERSKEVCYHWRKGNCNRGSKCGFSHVGKQDSPRSEHQATGNAPCRNGSACVFLARGKCNFYHNKNRFRHDQNRDRSRQERRPQAEREQCKFGRGCDRVPTCPYFHSWTDFPKYDQSKGFRKTQRAGSNRNQYRS